MSNDKIQKRVLWTVIVTECSHIFCCVLPMLFSVISLLSTFGLVVSMPGWLESLHDVMHNWELPMIIFSSVVIAIGWGVYIYSKKINCHDTGCEHEPCGQKKDTAKLILITASILLAFNVIIYFGFHRYETANAQQNNAHHHEHSHDH